MNALMQIDVPVAHCGIPTLSQFYPLSSSVLLKKVVWK